MQSQLIETTDSTAYTREINDFLKRKDISFMHISHSTCAAGGFIYYSCLIIYTAK